VQGAGGGSAWRISRSRPAGEADLTATSVYVVSYLATAVPMTVTVPSVSKRTTAEAGAPASASASSHTELNSASDGTPCAISVATRRQMAGRRWGASAMLA
jgi:hypothetical protein